MFGVVVIGCTVEVLRSLLSTAQDKWCTMSMGSQSQHSAFVEVIGISSIDVEPLWITGVGHHMMVIGCQRRVIGVD